MRRSCSESTPVKAVAFPADWGGGVHHRSGTEALIIFQKCSNTISDFPPQPMRNRFTDQQNSRPSERWSDGRLFPVPLLLFIGFQHRKTLLAVLYESVALHFGKFVAHGIFIYSQIIRQLLTIVRNLKSISSLLLYTIRKIGQQASADRPGTGMQHASGQLQPPSGTYGK